MASRSEPGWSGVDDVVGHEALIALRACLVIDRRLLEHRHAGDADSQRQRRHRRRQAPRLRARAGDSEEPTGTRHPADRCEQSQARPDQQRCQQPHREHGGGKQPERHGGSERTAHRLWW